MFNYKRVLGLAFLSFVAALSGCGGDDANKDPLVVCTGGEFINSEGVCEARPPSCPAGEVLDEVTGECGAPPFSGPVPVYQPAENEAVIYYNRQRSDQNYEGWSLYQWNDGVCSGWPDNTPSLGAWPGTLTPNGSDFAGTPSNPNALLSAVPPSGVDPLYGAFWVVEIVPPANPGAPGDSGNCGHYIINNFGAGLQTSDSVVRLNGEGDFARMAFVIVPDTGQLGSNEVVGQETPKCPGFDPDDDTNFGDCTPPSAATRRIADVAAHWIDSTTLIWAGISNEAIEAALYSSSTGGLTQDADGNIVAGDGGTVTLVGNMSVATLTPEQAARVPHLSGDGYTAFTIDGVTENSAKAALTGQLLAIATDGLNADMDVNLVGTAVQTARVLDAIYTFNETDADEAELGVTYGDDGISASVWAPTAQNVRIKLFSAADANNARILNSIESMELDSATGIWSYTGPSSLDGSYYLYEVQVYDPFQGLVAIVDSTDPYSVSLSTDSLYSQFVDLTSDTLKPSGWDGHEVPAVASPESAVIYEGHVRDFSIRDESTSAANRGKFLAFTEDSLPVQHLRELQQNGLTHFHLLPVFDIATVVEDPEFQVNLDDTIGTLCNLGLDSSIDDICDEASSGDLIIDVLRSFDPTSTDAQTLVNILKRVDGFNWGYDPYHFNVPEGSYASDAEGTTRIIEMRSMIQALHTMGLRVVMDVVYNHTNASGFNLKSTFDRIVPGYYYRRDAVSGGVEAATCCQDTASENRMMGKFITESLVQWAEHYKIDAFRFDLMGYHPRQLIVDSLEAVEVVDDDTYFYGEGWETGSSTAGGAIFEQATQLRLGGTGVGTFNDRMRDPLRRAALLNGDNADRIRVGLAGNLSNYEFYSSNGVLGTESGSYTLDPQENVAYVSKHDNEALWDWLHMEDTLPEDATMADRARAQVLTLSIPLLSQGVPFIHMGADLLRSKSMDGNSFDSGDWFNYVDFTQTDNNWNVGIPLEASAPEEDSFGERILANVEADPIADTIQWSSDVFNNFLAVSASTPLFSLTTEQQVIDRIGFHNTGILQTDGVVVMSIDDGDTPASLFDENAEVELAADIDLEDLDPNHDAVVVVINGTAAEVSHMIETATGFTLHATQAGAEGADETVKGASFDDMTSTFNVPGLTTAVFVKVQGADQGYGLYAGASPSPGGEIPNPFGVGNNMYLRGVNGDWGTSNQMVYDFAGNFTAFANLADGAAEQFKVANADWSTQFTVISETMIGVDVAMIDGSDQGNVSITIPAGDGGEYRFNVDAIDPNTPILNVARAESYAAAPIYARGLMGDWGTTRELAYQGESIYSEVFALTAGDMEFKVADEDWGGGVLTTGFNFGVPGDVPRYVAGDGSMVLNNEDGSSDNIRINIPADGDYLIKLDARSPLNPVLSIVLEEPFLGTPLFVRGVNGDWGTSSELVFQGNAIYVADISVIEASSEKFKIADADWSSGTNLGTESMVTFGERVIFTDGSPDALFQYATPEVTDDEDGDYTFTLDASGGKLEVTVKPATP